jgi:hypothetical protein
MCFSRRVGVIAVMTAGLLAAGCAEQETPTATPEPPETPEISEAAGITDIPGAGADIPAARYHASFTGKEGMAVQGTYHIEDHDGVLRLILDDAFKSDDGPDLHVVLSPVAPGEVSGSTAMAEGKALVVGKLGSLAGAQTYDLPDDLDFAAYRSVLIQCIKYSHLYAAAPLE